MTNQDAFSKVKAGINAQGGPAYTPAYTPGGGCGYRTPDGKKCAAGQLIPDDEYNFNLEGTSVMGLSMESRLPPSLKEIDISLLRAMQMAHDNYTDTHNNAEFLRMFNRQMSKVAAQFNLKDE